MAERCNIPGLREEVIASIPKHEVTGENVLDVAILDEATMLHEPLYDTL